MRYRQKLRRHFNLLSGRCSSPGWKWRWLKKKSPPRPGRNRSLCRPRQQPELGGDPGSAWSTSASSTRARTFTRPTARIAGARSGASSSPGGGATSASATVSLVPWRAGANENTVFTVSHDVGVEGQAAAGGPLRAAHDPGRPGVDDRLLQELDVVGELLLRPERGRAARHRQAGAAPYREWLTYDFIDREPDSATVALHWENLRVPFKIAVPNLVDLYVARIGDELRGQGGLRLAGLEQCGSVLPAVLPRPRRIHGAGAGMGGRRGDRSLVGENNFTTLSTKAQVLGGPRPRRRVARDPPRRRRAPRHHRAPDPQRRAPAPAAGVKPPRRWSSSSSTPTATEPTPGR